MSSIPKEVLLTADKLLRAGQWNSVFNGTSFKIGSFSNQPVQTSCPTYDFTKLRWVNYDKYFYWTPRSGPKTTLYGSDSKNYVEKGIEEGFISFGTGEEPDLYASYLDKKGCRVLSAFETNQIKNICKFEVKRRSLYEYCGIIYLMIDMPIIPPNEQMIGTIIQYGSEIPPGPLIFTSQCLYTVLIEILHPGPLLEAATCSTASNLSLNLCQNFCDTTPTGCVNIQTEYCNSEGVSTVYCENVCKTIPKLNCTVGLTNYCRESLNSYGNDVDILISKEANRCSCFLPDEFWNNYSLSINKYFKINSNISNVRCFFPLCSQRNVIQQHNTKNLLAPCPKDSGCIKSVDVNSFGELTGPVSTSSAVECNKYNSMNTYPAGVSPKPMTPQTVNKILPEFKNVRKPKTGSSAGIAFGLIGAGVLIFVLVTAVGIKKKLK